MITKLGNIILQPHQQRVVDRLTKEDIDGLIAYHSMGAGKSGTALKGTEKILKDNPEGRALFITPASLQENIYKELKKHNIDIPESRLLVRSYEKATRDADELKKEQFQIVVLDEAHKIRNAQTKRAQKLRDIISGARKKLLLSGTASYNHPVDLANLTKYINPEIDVPKTQTEFENKYIDIKSGKLTPTGKKYLRNNISKYVDLYESQDNPEFMANFPKANNKIIPVQMSAEQEKVYNFLEEKLPPKLRQAVRKNMPLSIKDNTSLNTFATGVRQASTSHFPYVQKYNLEDSPKLMAAVDSMVQSANNTPSFRGVAYSNYLKSGLNPYAELLHHRGITPQVLTGSLSRKEKADLVEQFNELSNTPKVMLISSSGGEGLDLKGVRKLQILEPHFNQSKIDQVKARAVRYKSHDHLPEDQRNVDIEEYHSHFAPKWYQKLLFQKPDTTIDRYLYNLSQRKQNTVDDIKGLLK